MATAKGIALGAFRLASWPWRVVPAAVRRRLVFGLMVLESRTSGPADALRRLFRIQDDLELLLAERATAYGGGEHPKHRLMRYHDFFVDRIPHGSRVLDIGCGYGAVARSIARRVPGASVTGIDMDLPRLEQARRADNPTNLDFVYGDALRDLPSGPWEVVVLSNVLEHIEGRVDFLRRLVERTGARRMLIRVPLFERHWQLPLRRELGVGYFSDPTHFIEHTLGEFDAEISAAGLTIVERLTVWGEIWADCRREPAA